MALELNHIMHFKDVTVFPQSCTWFYLIYWSYGIRHCSFWFYEYDHMLHLSTMKYAVFLNKCLIFVPTQSLYYHKFIGLPTMLTLIIAFVTFICFIGVLFVLIRVCKISYLWAPEFRVGRCKIPYMKQFRSTGYFIFHCNFVKHIKVIFHWITKM